MSSNVLSIKTDLGDDKLLAMRVQGRERLSRLPEYTVDVVGNASLLTGREYVSIKSVLGTLATVTIDVLGTKRYISGYVAQAVRGERHGRFDSYVLVLRPWLWFATRSKNSRVFQNETVQQIVNMVLDDYKGACSYKWFSAASSLPKLEYCVQYEESDFDFVSRLLEEYGVYYYFTHDEGTHTLMLANAMGDHATRKSGGSVVWANKFDAENRMIGWHSIEEVRPNKAFVRDYDYLASATPIEAEGVGSATFTQQGPGEIYEFPARVVLNQKEDAADATGKTGKAAKAMAKRIVEAAQSMHKLHSGECNAHDLACGTKFKIENTPLLSDNGEYLIVASEFRAEYGDHEAIEDLKSIKRNRDGYVASVEALDTKFGIFRPQRVTTRPRMLGPQTALVVGASGNEIETDAVGRIKIKFPWDRDPKKNQTSSCWVRVAQPWAGKKMGLWMLPRIGDEVVVSFIGGDPDRPIVTGSVHNDANPPPYKLPAHADVATWISRSTKGGAADAQNELRFCDTKDSEHVWFQAQKAFYRHVKGDTFDHLEMNETKKVKLTRKEVIGENWYMNVTKDVMHEFAKDQHTKVTGDIFTTGGATWQIQLAKDYGLKVGADAGIEVTGKTALKSGGDVNVQSDGKINLKATGNLVGEATGKVSLKSAADVLMEGLNIKAKGGAEIVLEASTGIKIVCGSSVITLGPTGVTIDGPLVKVNCGGGGGSAGSAESAAAAEPKAVAEAKFQEELQPAKAQDYDKKLADPLPPAQAAAPPAIAPPTIKKDLDGEVAAKLAAAAAAAQELADKAAAKAAALKAAAVAAAVGAIAAASAVGGGAAASAADEELNDPDSGLAKAVNEVQDFVDDATEKVSSIDKPIEGALDVAHEWVEEESIDQAKALVAQGLEAGQQALDVAEDVAKQAKDYTTVPTVDAAITDAAVEAARKLDGS